MNSNTISISQIVVSDLFQGPYDHAKRLTEQEILHTRLSEYKDDQVLMDVAGVLKDMTDSKIASVVHQEAVIEKLHRYAKTGKIEVL